MLDLSNSTLILELPFPPITRGDSIIVGSDNRLYTVVRDRNAPIDNVTSKGLILRTTLDGTFIQNKSSENNSSENNFASRILNFSGMTLDPVTNLLWDVERRSNGVAQINQIRISLNGDFYKSEPTWSIRSPITAITFFNSSSLGPKYTNSLAIGDEDGNIYLLGLDKERRNILLNQNLTKDLLASGFGPISDLKIGTDGALYVLTRARNITDPLTEESGSLYRISTSGVDLPVPQSKYIRADYLGLALTSALAVALIMCATWVKFGRLRFPFRKIKRSKNENF
jgi:glucose/arabinose dehydrogenase